MAPVARHVAIGCGLNPELFGARKKLVGAVERHNSVLAETAYNLQAVGNIIIRGDGMLPIGKRSLDIDAVAVPGEVAGQVIVKVVAFLIYLVVGRQRRGM